MLDTHSYEGFSLRVSRVENVPSTHFPYELQAIHFSCRHSILGNLTCSMYCLEAPVASCTAAVQLYDSCSRTYACVLRAVVVGHFRAPLLT
jgi:hypothetical protein